jgi:hypothetical protein
MIFTFTRPDGVGKLFVACDFVDAKEGARDFYLKYEFTPFATQPDRLFLLMKNIDLMFE